MWEKTMTVKHWKSLKREATGSIKNFSGQQFEQRDEQGVLAFNGGLNLMISRGPFQSI